MYTYVCTRVCMYVYTTIWSFCGNSDISVLHTRNYSQTDTVIRQKLNILLHTGFCEATLCILKCAHVPFEHMSQQH